MPKSHPRYAIRRTRHNRYNAAEQDAKNKAWQAAQDEQDEETQKRKQISHINTLDLLADTPAEWWQRYMERESEATHAWREHTAFMIELVIVLCFVELFALAFMVQFVMTHA